MITSKAELKEYLQADKTALRRIEKRPKYTDLTWKYQILLRKCEYLYNCKPKSILYKFYKLRLFNLGLKCGFEIPLNVFGKGLKLTHKGTIVINKETKVGENCRLHVGVNIGTKTGHKDFAPTIGNNVYIAPGAKIFGKINIADDIIIGANSVVNKSFDEPNIVIAGVPAKKIKNRDDKYAAIRHN